MQSTRKQRQQIGYLRKVVGLDEDTYRDMLAGYNVSSSKELDIKQAGILINKLRDIGVQTGSYKPKKMYSFNKYKFNSLGERDEKMATPAQLRYIEIMWFGVSNQKTDEARAIALEKMLMKIVGKQKLRFLTKTDVAKVLQTLKMMEAQKNDSINISSK